MQRWHEYIAHYAMTTPRGNMIRLQRKRLAASAETVARLRIIGAQGFVSALTIP